jgi:hypothetical protein
MPGSGFVVADAVRFELGVGVLDRIEIGRIGRQQNEACAASFVADGGAFMCGIGDTLRAPGIPCALDFLGQHVHGKYSRASAARSRSRVRQQRAVREDKVSSE